MNRIPPARRSGALCNGQTQSPHDSGRQSAGCSPQPPTHRGKAPSSPPRSSHNTGRPRSAGGPRQPPSFPSADRAEHRGAGRPAHKCSARRW